MATPHSLKVLLSSYPDPEAEKVRANLLRVYDLSDRRHSLVERPEDADLILIGGIGNESSQDRYVRETLHHPLISRFPGKCFTVSYRDKPLLLNRGVYESALESRWNTGRCVTGSYALSGHYNPAIQSAENIPKDLLFSFVGRMSHPVRRQLMAMRFQREDIFLEDTSTFNYWACSEEVRQDREQQFSRVLARSRFCLCPRGVGAGSIRLFEAMRSGVAPIVIADRWIWPEGLPWEKFSIRVAESHLHHLERIVAEREDDFARMGAMARLCWEETFADDTYFEYLVSRCADLRKNQVLPEALYWSLRHLYVAYTEYCPRLRSYARVAIARVSARRS
ncbi:glycosyltransferase family 47 protein [Terriglobus aquaticus]|uniref:Glycosyltransferase family 47 protein n=1 Tax=Terriglobus aquaticus TaxID=940139 RepID=A0ABW9KGB1_9BACT|nr:glycosyltransferase family 47 protein [Terriglobus aquaticus]